MVLYENSTSLGLASPNGLTPLGFPILSIPFIAHRQCPRLQHKLQPPTNTNTFAATNVGLTLFLIVPIVGIRVAAGAESNNPPLSAVVGAESPPLQ
ncbi:hypothetical protein GYH30_033473 [Glycine max]|nr:hypothetical protein GYH30_033473 [Glycine max]